MSALDDAIEDMSRIPIFVFLWCRSYTIASDYRTNEYGQLRSLLTGLGKTFGRHNHPKSTSEKPLPSKGRGVSRLNGDGQQDTDNIYAVLDHLSRTHDHS